ncbi:ABC transporter ATP-binding protein [Brachybacterium nesterenkovii]|uniref:Duplicated ATPase component MtsB of energizing module of methionine-regulated ECF transporter n=1 Tax=Brachybacterium nesterenkovii TaxID=47847 RepID=A0A1X6X8L6_9MICO|nr:ABC transporter ATP-binding protein [Brachybacterium nesterenkovii]SLM95581.1 Duplicated ATPase component MtsB of energizing module of methionine-regulated ECF transporter [Brachybacterium nesterenkovii]
MTVPADRDRPSADADEAVIELRDVTFQYRAQSEPTLHGIDLTVRRGEKIAVVGASGSGKSTLLSLLNGLVPHRFGGTLTGSVRVAGAEPAAVPLVRTARHVGTVLQDPSGQFVGLTVAEDIAFSLENQEVPSAQMPERVRAAATAAGIADRLGAAPQDLSGGQKQRVSIAGVLVDEVDVLLFDEPLAMLDPATGREAVELIDALHRERGITIVIVEHRLEDVLHRDVDRIVLMADGRIVADAPPDEIVASGMLERHGIRPPLHVAALACAGAPVTAAQRPANAERIELTETQIAAIRTWVASAGDLGGAPRTAPAGSLEIEGLGCVLGGGDGRGVRALEGVSTRIGRGEMVGILGSNGAGKSTLARVICGFEAATAGVVRLDGIDIAPWPIAERGEHVGFVLQEPGQMISASHIAEEIALGLRARGLDDAEIARRTESVLDVCGLRPFRTWPVSALSHGQKKRLTIAAVLALEPRVLILDEPTAGQDFAHYTEFMDFLAAVNAGGTTVLLITHDMHLALEYTERVLVMAQGRLLADAHPADVLTDADITARADLVTTGLYALARRCGIADPSALVRRFVAADRAARTRPDAPVTSAATGAAPEDTPAADGGAR